MPEISKEQIKELIVLAKTDNESAFGEIYTKFITPIYRFIYFRVGSKEEAEDLTQTVFLRAWKALDKFDEKTHFSAWLYTIARNAVIDYWKQKKWLFFGSMEEELSEMPDFEFLEREKNMEKIKSALAELTVDQQNIIKLKYVEDFSNSEISKKTGKSEEAVRQIQCRAIKQLKNLLC